MSSSADSFSLYLLIHGDKPEMCIITMCEGGSERTNEMDVRPDVLYLLVQPGVHYYDQLACHFCSFHDQSGIPAPYYLSRLVNEIQAEAQGPVTVHEPSNKILWPCRENPNSD